MANKGGTMLGGKIPNYSDGHYGITASDGQDTSLQLQRVKSIFGPMDYNVDMNQFTKIGAMSLVRAYAPVSKYMSDVFIVDVDQNDRDSWIQRLAPLLATEDLSYKQRIYIEDPTSLDIAPERTSPNYVSYTIEETTFYMYRYSKGTEAYHDFYKSDSGTEEVKFKLGIIARAAMKTAKLCVLHAILNSKTFHQETQRKVGLLSNNLKELYDNELNIFGCFNLDWKGLPKLAAYWNRIARASPGVNNFDMAVVPQGTMDFLALANNKLTTATQVGEKLAVETLQQGGAVIRKLVSGVDIYEDTALQAQNLGEEEMQLLTSTVRIGEYVPFSVNSGHTSSYFDERSSIEQSKVEIIDLPNDAYAGIDVQTMIQNSLRWKSDGSLSENHYQLRDRLNNEIDVSGVGIDGENLDPYLWNAGNHSVENDEDDQYKSVRSNTSGWNVVENWGDMDTRYWSLDQSVAVGDDMANFIRSKTTPVDEKNFRDLKSIINILSDATGLNEYDNYFAEIVAGHVNGLAPANAFGFVDLPSRLANNGNVKAGFPKYPIGFGNIAGLITLAHAYSSGKTQGWDVDFLKRVHDAVDGWRVFWSHIRKLLPECETANSAYVPYYMYSNDNDLNAEYAFFSNFIDTVKNPAWFKPDNNLNNTAVDQLIALVETTYGSGTPFGGALQKMLKEELSPLNVTLVSTKWADVKKTFMEVFEPTLFGTKHGPGDTENTKITNAWNALLTNLDKNARAAFNQLSAILSMINHKLTEPEAKVDPFTKTNFQQAASMDVSKKRRAKELDGLDVSGYGPYVSTRLTFSNSTWINHSNLARNDQTNLRPSHPTKPAMPFIAADVNNVKPFMKYAKSPFETSSGDATIFGNQHLSQYEFSNSQQVTQQSKSQAFTQSSGLISSSYRDSFYDDMSSESKKSKKYGQKVTLVDPTDDDHPYQRGTEALLQQGRNVFQKLRSPNRFLEKPFLKTRFSHVSSERETDPLARACALGLLLSNVHRQSLLALAARGIKNFPDSTFLIVRPFIELRMDAMILAKTVGVKTANILFKNEDVVRQLDGSNKIWKWHYSILMGCAIWNARNVMVIPHVRSRQYVSGMDMSIFKNQSDFNPRDITTNTKSIFIFSCGARFNEEIARSVANPLSIFGYISKQYVPYDVSSDFAKKYLDNRNRPQFPSFHYYNLLWRFSDINYGRKISDGSVFSDIRRNPPYHGMCFVGHSRRYNPATMRFEKTDKTTGSGHLSKFDVPGMLSALNGSIQMENNRNN
jgi:hypothetical protein